MSEPSAPRVAVVTGAATGIGRAAAMALAQKGYTVAVCDVEREGTGRTVDDVLSAGGRARAVAMDVSDSAGVAEAVEEIRAALGTPSAVVSAAGIMKISPFLDLEVAAWRRTLDVNLTGTFLVLQACARVMVADAVPGAMVAVASVAARGPRADAGDYAASKAGVVSVTQSAAVALAPHGIRVNAVCPGMVDTVMTQRNLTDRATELGVSPDEVLATMLSRVPLSRLARADEVASVIASLIDSDFGYVTGQAINVDGGLEFE